MTEHKGGNATLSVEMQRRMAEHEAQRPERIRRWLEHAVLFAYDEGQLSEGQGSSVLGVDRLEFRDRYILWREEQQPIVPDDDGTDQFETHWSAG